LEGFGLRDSRAAGTPGRYGRWLRELTEDQHLRDYVSFAELEQRLRRNNPRLTAARATFLARHWGEETADGRVRLRSDPAHKRVNPIPYHLAEARACWSAVTAPVLWVEGDDTRAPEHLHMTREEIAARKSAFANLKSVVIPGAGHMVHHDQPEALAAVMEEFLLT
jgi:pimeloyl-ACP methyl ester carboxylesterase